MLRKKADLMSRQDFLDAYLNFHNAKLIRYNYYDKCFGNFIVEIEFNNVVHTFITDRGEIYYNNQMICDSSYHKSGKSDTFIKLIEIIKQELLDK